MTRANYAQIATTPLMFVINSWGVYEATNIALGLAMPMAFMKFSRGFESEADYLGLQYMYKAGYDPQAFVSFFEKIQAREKQKPGTLSKAFASHPPTPDRIAKSEAEIKDLLPGRSQYVVDTSEFDSVKARLAAFEDRKKVIAPSDKDKPTLRQTKTADASTTAPQNPNDDHPTLSKRDDD
jgi:predicted Zn-dependent protease